MYRVVLDPGVLVSALLSPIGAPALLLEAWLNRRYRLVVSPGLMDELERVLSRPKFRKYCSLAEAQEYCGSLRQLAELVADPPHQAALTPDPADDYLAALARAVSADFLISGDAVLVNLADPNPPILSPREFLERLGPP